MKYLHKLVLHYYKDRDYSHDYNHVFKVYNIANKIAKNERIINKRQLLIIKCASLFHDVWDNKYVKSKKEKEILQLELRKDLENIKISKEEIDDIYEIIENISYTKEKKQRNKNERIYLKRINKLREIVSDSDKIESTGKEGIIRIIEYERMIKENESVMYYIKKVKDLYKNRILDIIENDYIRTKSGKEIIKERMKDMESIINDEKELYMLVDEIINKEN